MTRHLIAVPAKGDAEHDRLVKLGISLAINELFAADVIAGKLIHNVDTDEFRLAEKADDEFRADAAAAYERMLNERSAL